MFSKGKSMNDKKVLIGFILVTILMLAGGVFMLSNISSTGQINGVSTNAIFSANEKNFDWGQIAYSGPDATKTFTIKNSGTEILKLTNIKTSCACTKAQLIIDGKSSPYFSMHTTSSWIGEISPDKQASLTVIFDPDFHGPPGVGAVERIISMETNDASNQKVEFFLKGVVVK